MLIDKEIPACRTSISQVADQLGIALTAAQLNQLATHFALLLAWNRKMNLTSLRDREEIAWRHIGESILLTRVIDEPESGLLVDVGSGGGFPGLPVAILWPKLNLIMLEPNKRKAAFLKEAVRACGVGSARVQASTLEDAVENGLAGQASLVTMRALAPTDDTIRKLGDLLAPGGILALYLGASDVARSEKYKEIVWRESIRISKSESRMILVGRKP